MKQTVVALTWTLKDSLGEVLDQLDEPVEFYVGGDDLLPAIEQALLGRHAGDSIHLHLEPEHAFGDYDENLVYLESLGIFPPGLAEGMVIDSQALPESASSTFLQPALLTVTEIYPEHVVLDGNHPLAGISLDIDIRIDTVRPSREDEQRAGSAGVRFFDFSAAEPGGQTLH